MEGDEGSDALTPSSDRLLTARELEEGFLGLSPASPPSSAVDWSQLTQEASKLKRKLARAFTFSSESVAKRSPVTQFPQSLLNPSSEPGTTKAPNSSAPSAQLKATYLVTSKQVKPTNSVKETVHRLQPASKAHSQLRLNKRPGEARTNVRNKNDQKEVQQRKTNLTNEMKTGDRKVEPKVEADVGEISIVEKASRYDHMSKELEEMKSKHDSLFKLLAPPVKPEPQNVQQPWGWNPHQQQGPYNPYQANLKVLKETRPSTGEAAKSSGTRAITMQPPKPRPRLPSTSRQPQPRLPSKTGLRGDISRDKPTLNQGASKSENPGKKELQRLQQSLEAMQGVDKRREGVIVGLKQEVHSLSMVLEMRSKELREEKEKRVTLEMKVAQLQDEHGLTHPQD